MLTLIDEARDFAKKQILSRQEEGDENQTKYQINEEEIDKVSEILGLGAIKYFDLR